MKRPVAVTILGWLFVLAGTVGFIYHIPEFRISQPFQNDAAWVLAVRLLGILGGVLVLKGINAGRWLLIVWMFYHVVLSFFHDLTGLIMHAVMLGVMAYIFFHRKVNAFFGDYKKYP